jgi:F0F1-type ATP synthase membrane subunit c/vacuolar-type H+-ATPase subunit K
MRFVLLALVVGIGIGFAGARATSPISPVAAQPAADFSHFSGFWSHHDGFIRISKSGVGFESHRTYVNCKNPEASGCDYLGKKYIYNGGYLSFRLTGMKNGKAVGYISGSSASWLMHTDITVGSTGKDAITLWYGNTSVRGCGTNATPGYCGA